MQKLSGNVAIGLHSHPLLHQFILPILSCGVNLISYPQLFSSSDAKCFLGIALGGSISNGFNGLFFDVWRVAGIRKRF